MATTRPNGQSSGMVTKIDSDAREVIDWIHGRDSREVSVSKSILGKKHSNSKSLLELDDKNEFKEMNYKKDALFTFGTKKPTSFFKSLSPRTNFEVDSQLDEMLNQLTGKRAGRGLQNKSLDKSGLSQRKNIKQSSDIFEFKTKKSIEELDNSDIIRVSTHRSHLVGAEGDNLPRKSKNRSFSRSIREIELRSSSEKKNTSFEILNTPTGKISQPNKLTASFGQKLQPTFDTNLSDIFTNEALLSQEKSSRQRTGEKEGLNRKSLLGSLSSIHPSTELKNMMSSGLNMKTRLHQTLFKETEEVKREKERQKNISETTREIKNSLGMIPTISSKSLVATKASKNFSSKLKYGPLSIQKFVNAILLVSKRSAGKELFLQIGSKNKNYAAGFKELEITLLSLFCKRAQECIDQMKEFAKKKKFYSRGLKDLEKVMQKRRLQSLCLSLKFVYLDSLCERGSFLKSQLKAHFKHSNSISLKTMRLIKALSEKKAYFLKKFLTKKMMLENQLSRRALYHIRSQLSIKTEYSRKALNRMVSFIEMFKQKQLISGFYGVVVAGGRFDKLRIIVQRRVKVYEAKMKYCLRKLKIWSKYKSSQLSDLTGIKTIILRTSDPQIEHQNATLKRMVLRKAMIQVQKVFNDGDERDLQYSLAQIRYVYLFREKIPRLFVWLHTHLVTINLRQSWVELQLHDVQQKSISVLNSHPTKPKQRPILGQAINFYAKDSRKSRESPGTNPLFKFFEKTASPKSFENFKDDSSHFTSELELLQSGLELDDQILQTKLSKKPRTSGQKVLEASLKKNSSSKSKQLSRIQLLRGLVLKLQTLKNRTLRQAFDSLMSSLASSQLLAIKIEYLTLGVKALHKIFKNSKLSHFKVLSHVKKTSQRKLLKSNLKFYRPLGQFRS